MSRLRLPIVSTLLLLLLTATYTGYAQRKATAAGENHGPSDTRWLFVLEAPQLEPSHERPIRRSLLKRLEGIYDGPLRNSNIAFRENTVFITLQGDVDTAAVARGLTLTPSLELLPGYGPAEMDSIWALLPPEATDSGLMARDPHTMLVNTQFATLTPADSTAAAGYIDQALKTLGMTDAGAYFGPTSNLPDYTTAYILNRKARVVSQADLLECDFAFDEVNGMPRLDFSFSKQAGETLAAYTEAHTGEMLAIVINGKVIMAPTIQGVIPNGRMSLSGGLTLAEMTDLQRAIGYPYPVPLQLAAIQQLDGE